MLQLTLSRGRLLIGWGYVSPYDTHEAGRQAVPASPAIPEVGPALFRGSRPAVVFGPHKDAHSLVTRKMHTVIVLKSKLVADLNARVWVLNFPAGEHVSCAPWIDAVSVASEGRGLVRMLEMRQCQSDLPPDCDVYRQTFEVENGTKVEAGSKVDEANSKRGAQGTPISFPQGTADLGQLKVHFESFVEEDALRERITLTGLHSNQFDAFVVHWHEPEIGVSSLLQTSFVADDLGLVGSYRGDVFLGVQGIQGHRPAPLAFAQCGELQRGRSALNSLAGFLQGLLLHADLVGFAAHAKTPGKAIPPCARPNQVLCGHTDALAAWHFDLAQPFELSLALKPSLDALLSFKPLPFDDAKNKVMTNDRSWVARAKPLPPHANLPRIKALYERTLLTLRQMQDESGGIIAAPEFHFEFKLCGGYGYCWGRDAGFISYAMDVCGLHAESAAFYRYMARCQSADGSFLHRHDMQGNLGASWGFLQPDETASVVFGLWQHVSLAGNRELALELRGLVEKAADWLCASRYLEASVLPVAGIDLWEEREGIHLYTVSAMVAGLQAALDLSAFMGWPKPAHWESRLRELHTLVNSEVFIARLADTTLFARTIKKTLSPEQALALQAMGEKIEVAQPPGIGRLPSFTLERDFVVDVSQLGVVIPFGALDSQKNGEVFENLVDLVEAKLWRPGVGGIGRYEGDRYRDGNPWVLATLWFALAAAAQGRTDQARRAFQWTLDHATPEGLLAEQIDPLTGQPAWVMPLTWSHAMFALAAHQLPPACMTK